MDKVKILFVCLGNICRSPSAEAVCLHYIKEEGLAQHFEIDSAGLIAAHQGERADRRMREHAFQRDYRLDSLSRPITYEDFDYFDYIVCMDASNYSALRELAPTQEACEKISILPNWDEDAELDHVPDPYYGGARGFELVLDLLEQCIPKLITKVLKEQKKM